MDRTGCRASSRRRWCYCSCPCRSHTRAAEEKVHISVVCMLLPVPHRFSSMYIASPPRSLFAADAHARRWIYLSTLAYINVDASRASSTCPRPHSAFRARASCWTDPMTPHSLPTRPGLHLRAPRPHSRHTKQVAFFIWHSPPNHLPQNALWILLRGVL